MKPERIHVIFKTHLDVGFTDFSAAVIQKYMDSYIPRAIELARSLRESGAAERFIWTTGSYLIYEYLERADPADREKMEAAILAGDIAWHALPFTTHSEAMDASLFRYGLSLSQRLDARFGRHTIAAKMTDVPGHTRAIVPLLAEAGVQFLHIGVNQASMPPAVPDVFNWQAPGGERVMVMYHKTNYGDLMVVPGLGDAIYFAHTGDNLGPQGKDELRATFEGLRAQFPGTPVQASTLDAFAEQLAAVRDTLPVITEEIGDTWIHGIGSDPAKIAAFRALSRLRRHWLTSGTASEAELDGFSRRLLCVPEHTWGLDVKTHLGDWENWTNRQFKGVRALAHYQKMEASWREQRAYLTQAIDALPTPEMQQQAAQAQAETLPAPFDLRHRFTPLNDPSAPIKVGRFTAALDALSGALIKLTAADGTEFATPAAPLGKFWYQTFSADDYTNFHRDYNQNKLQTANWALPDFCKPNLESAAPLSQRVMPVMTFAGQYRDTQADHLLAVLSLRQDVIEDYGAPREVSIHYAFPHECAQVHITLRWKGKTATRLPEALWFSFMPTMLPLSQWHLRKLGEWISPLGVVESGNRHLHAVDAARNQDWLLETLDAPLCAPGKTGLVAFDNRNPNLRDGLHFNLYNNQWGTNFTMWYEDDGLARFILTPQGKA